MQSNLLCVFLFLISPWGGCWRCWQLSARKAAGGSFRLCLRSFPQSGQCVGDSSPSAQCPLFVTGAREAAFPNKQVESPLEGCRAQFLIALTDDIVYLSHRTLVFESFSYPKDLWQPHFSNFPKATWDLETKCVVLRPFVDHSEACKTTELRSDPSPVGAGKAEGWREPFSFPLCWNLNGTTEGDFILKSLPPHPASPH